MSGTELSGQSSYAFDDDFCEPSGGGSSAYELGEPSVATHHDSRPPDACTQDTIQSGLDEKTLQKTDPEEASEDYEFDDDCIPSVGPCTHENDTVPSEGLGDEHDDHDDHEHTGRTEASHIDGESSSSAYQLGDPSVATHHSRPDANPYEHTEASHRDGQSSDIYEFGTYESSVRGDGNREHGVTTQSGGVTHQTEEGGTYSMSIASDHQPTSEASTSEDVAIVDYDPTACVNTAAWTAVPYTAPCTVELQATIQIAFVFKVENKIWDQHIELKFMTKTGRMEDFGHVTVVTMPVDVGNVAYIARLVRTVNDEDKEQPYEDYAVEILGETRNAHEDMEQLQLQCLGTGVAGDLPQVKYKLVTSHAGMVIRMLTTMKEAAGVDMICKAGEAPENGGRVLGAGTFGEVRLSQSYDRYCAKYTKESHTLSRMKVFCAELLPMLKLCFNSTSRFVVELKFVDPINFSTYVKHVNHGNLRQFVISTEKNNWTYENTTFPEMFESFSCTLAKAIEYVHSKGFIHRDIKPENVLVDLHDKRLISILADFGLAIAMNSPEAVLRERAGTRYYMAPELCPRGKDQKGKDKVSTTTYTSMQSGDCGRASPMSDIFSFGRTIEWVRRGYRGAVQDCFLKPCLAELPARRPTALDLVKSLEEIESNGQTPALIPPPKPLSTVQRLIRTIEKGSKDGCSEAYNNLGNRIPAGQLEEVDGVLLDSEMCFKRAIAADPNSAHALFNLSRLVPQGGQTTLNDGTIMTRESLLKQAISIDAHHARALRNLALLLPRGASTQIIQYNGPSHVSKEALLIRSLELLASAEVYINLACAMTGSYVVLDKKRKTKQDLYRAALTLDSKNITAYLNLAALLSTKEVGVTLPNGVRCSKGALLKRVVALDPNNLAAYKMLLESTPVLGHIVLENGKQMTWAELKKKVWWDGAVIGSLKNSFVSRK